MDQTNLLLQQILQATGGIVGRLDDLERSVESVETAVFTLEADKADKVGDITLVGVFTPAGGTGAYVAI